jgi:hypothetical protein
VLCLDAWHTEAHRCNPEWNTLEVFATSNPDRKAVEEMADTLAAEYVAGGDVDIFDIWTKPVPSRDYQHENVLLMHQYFLLYEEMSYSMNYGDIG